MSYLFSFYILSVNWGQLDVKIAYTYTRVASFNIYENDEHAALKILLRNIFRVLIELF